MIFLLRLLLVMCGSAAGARSAARREYYAGRGNKLWSTLHQIGLTPRTLTPAEYRELLAFRIGLTDLVKGQSGIDRGIGFDADAGMTLRRRILSYRPGCLCFNGKRAAQEFFGRSEVEYGVQSDRIGETSVFVAPSTSGAAGAFWDASVWRALAEHIASRQAAV
jgi:TDG/mug DNA glycosylase family protein